MLKNKMLSASAAVAPVFIEDVFSTYLYTGNGSTQTIVNGIDLAGKGGLVWRKQRTAISWTSWTHHSLSDTERGVNKAVYSSLTRAEDTGGDSFVTAFNSNGFSIGPDSSGFGTNKSTETYASWTFRKAERFFDVVTYTGNGQQLFPGRTINHNLGVVPGCIIIKNISTTANWHVEHRGLTEWIAGTYRHSMSLNTASASGTTGSGAYSALPIATSTTFNIVGGSASELLPVNTLGNQYVAYLFAHDPLGPSGDGSDGLIACGSYTGNGSATGPEINLGWEPQWILVKRATGGTGDWVILDNMRDFGVSTSRGLEPNSSSQEPTATNIFGVRSTGFQVISTDTEYNASGSSYIYIAIRRGPMREPTSGTEVFAINLHTGSQTVTTGFPVDFIADECRQANVSIWGSRLQGFGTTLTPSSSNAEGGYGSLATNVGMTSFTTSTSFTESFVAYSLRRAPGFFDVVAYTGTGSARTVTHNLGVAPELIITKQRSAAGEGWATGTEFGSTYKYLLLNSTAAATTRTAAGDNFYRTVSATAYDIGIAATLNTSAATYVAYLFATLPDVSKVGSYTGNGSSQTINCGFTGGARFVLIKRTDSTGDWYVWDTARGIVASNDPHLSLNTTVAEVTTNDSIDPDSSGFIVNQVAATNINVNAASYIYLAIA